MYYICINEPNPKNQKSRPMKKLMLLLVLCTCGLLSQPTSAQVSFRANISLQPIWGPIGYDHVEYYYLPEIEAYYYVPTHTFTYMENGRWVSRPYLAGRYKNYDLFGARKIVINEQRPYLRHQQYRTRYISARGYSRPMSIRDSRDSKYYVISNHPEHARYISGGRGVNSRTVINKVIVNDHRAPMNDHRGTMNNRTPVNNNRGTVNRGTVDNKRAPVNNNRGNNDNNKDHNNNH
jgi:hypothetical protein